MPDEAAPNAEQEQLARLETFVFGDDPFHSEAVPTGLDRATVLKFVRSRIGRSTELKPLLAAEKVVDYYDLQEAGDHYSDLLARVEPGEKGLLRAAVCARTLAKEGRPADLRLARARFASLAAAAASHPADLQLIGLYDALGPGTDPAPLKARLQQQIAQLAGQRPKGDEPPPVELAELEDLRDLELPRAEKANALKEKLLAVGDRAQRIDELVKAYMGVAYGYPEYLQPWAARQLRREVWGDQPRDQAVRRDDPQRRAELVEAFRRFTDATQKDEKLPPEEKSFYRTRGLHAVLFFGGEVLAEERAYLKQQAAAQVDPLFAE